MRFTRTPDYHAWRGYSFEIVCLNHLREIKRALGIEGIESMEYSWRSKEAERGAQIDLLIDRTDNCINIFEMKYTESPFVIDAEYESNLRNKIDCFRSETKTKKALFLTMVTASGLSKNAHSGIVVNEITADDLFA